jgi:long-subunit fatty acid transport protein
MYSHFFKLRVILSIVLVLSFGILFSQTNQNSNDETEYFWKKVQWGGGFGLGLGNRFTNISLSPMGVYSINEKVSVGVGLQYNYINQKDFFDAHMYGGSLIALFNPIEDIQLSAELEQLRVDRTFKSLDVSDSFWNSALFLGAGYRTNFAVVGFRYNVLFRESDNVYGQAWMPFIRIMF